MFFKIYFIIELFTRSRLYIWSLISDYFNYIIDICSVHDILKKEQNYLFISFYTAMIYYLLAKIITFLRL